MKVVIVVNALPVVQLTVSEHWRGLEPRTTDPSWGKSRSGGLILLHTLSKWRDSAAFLPAGCLMSILYHQRTTYTAGIYHVVYCLQTRYGDGAGNTVEENSSIFSLIRIR